MDVQSALFEKMSALSPMVDEHGTYQELVGCTEQLINLSKKQGRLECDPFESVWQRKVNLDFEGASGMLKNCTCIVTGGLGCVGAELISQLLKFDVARVVVLDIADPDHLTYCSDKLIHFHCDITDYASLVGIFHFYRPNFVFHVAGQRDPGHAESHIRETIETNVFGTMNVVKACEATKVEQCVFASTGKASRYYTEEVYAASKKICEFILDVYSRFGSVTYSLVRFTHILDNSLMRQQIRYTSRFGRYVSLHSAGKYVTAQNAREAATLMLNALLMSSKGRAKFLVVKNLEWPVESVEIALYEILQSGRRVPIVFQGNPRGYAEKFFRGQLNWSRPDELNLLLNVYEHRFREVNTADDIIISDLVPVDIALLNETLVTLSSAKSDEGLRKSLVTGLRRLVQESLKHVSKEDTANILRWGQEKNYPDDTASNDDFEDITKLLVDSLEDDSHTVEKDRRKGAIILENYSISDTFK